jgi:lipoprotein-releasing system permease protein
MYKLQLIRKYLVKRRIAWVALVAVMLCTAMVLVVVSVMGGWLRMFVNSFHGMTGDVVITTSSMTGFPDYQEMIDRVRKEVPGVTAAVPIIRCGGLLNLGNSDVQPVQVLGYPPDIGLVNAWPATLHTTADEKRKELLAAAAAATNDTDRKFYQSQLAMIPFSLRTDVPYELLRRSKRAPDPRNRTGMIVSSALVGIKRSKPQQAADTRSMMYETSTTLTMVPVTGGEGVDTSRILPVPLWIVDDSSSQIWQLDNNTVYISFDEAQRETRMVATDTDAARCSEVEIKAAPGADLMNIRDKVETIADQVRAAHPDDFKWYGYEVETWQQQQGPFIKAVQNEVVLTTGLFGVISSVAVLLIFCIFYMIVVEKTKDIGIIKSVGATGGGILSLFLGYGLAIGVIGAGLGLVTAYLFVHNINSIHSWLGRQLGIVIWSADTYQFDKIPNTMDPKTVYWVLLTAVLSALLGALVPAMRAAVMNPVDALRYE